MMPASLMATPTALEDGDEAEATSEIAVTVEIPAMLESFEGAALVATLYEYDPRLADVGAQKVDQVVVRNLGHQQEITQTLRFSLGQAIAQPHPQRRYYISCRIYDDIGDEDGFVEGDQIHYCHNEHDRLPGTVYDETNGNALTFTAQ